MPEKSKEPLMDFASANCFFWYFKDNNIPTNDISKITGGIVEMSSYSADKFQQVVLLVKNYSPKLKVKHEVDIQLAKCFLLKDDASFIKELKTIGES
ncbi:hypothetical protein [Pseudoalteromonas prydzensis]|uniref:hypothetical protein n=1 Tax=Pseudoalteromonas prydzensis TaxID=182141 RepID=UPI003FD64B71